MARLLVCACDTHQMGNKEPRDHFKNHQESCPQKGSLSQKKELFICELCRKVFTSNQNLKKHKEVCTVFLVD